MKFHISSLLAVCWFICLLSKKELHEQTEKLKLDQAMIAKLEVKLDQIAEKNESEKIEVSMAGRTEFVFSNQIVCCKAAGDYLELRLKNSEEKLYSGSMKQLEEVLPPVFLKVHRSYLVNLTEVTALSASTQDGRKGAHLVLTNSQEVPVSRRLLPAVRQSLKTAS